VVFLAFSSITKKRGYSIRSVFAFLQLYSAQKLFFEGANYCY